MSALDRDVLAEKTQSVVRHLARVAERLVRAAGFRNTVAHAYEALDMARVYRAAKDGPSDLLAFLGALRDRIASRPARQRE